MEFGRNDNDSPAYIDFHMALAVNSIPVSTKFLGPRVNYMRDSVLFLTNISLLSSQIFISVLPNIFRAMLTQLDAK